MIITRTSPIRGITRTLDLPITPAQFELWQSGTGAESHIQNALSNLSDGDREFIKSSITEEEWNAEFCNPNTLITDCEMTVRTTNCLTSIGVKTVQDLSQHTEQDLLLVKDFHKRCLAEVIDVLDSYKLKLRIA